MSTNIHYDVERVGTGRPYERRAAERIVIHVRRSAVMSLIRALARGYGTEKDIQVDQISVHLDVNPHEDNVYPTDGTRICSGAGCAARASPPYTLCVACCTAPAGACTCRSVRGKPAKELCDFCKAQVGGDTVHEGAYDTEGS